MSRTNLDAAALAKSLRNMAGSGDVEWVHEPMRASELLDIADLLDENDKLQEQLDVAEHNRKRNVREYARMCHENDKLRELVRDIWQFTGAACKKYPKLFDPPAQGGQMVQPNAIDLFEQRIREMGVTDERR